MIILGHKLKFTLDCPFILDLHKTFAQSNLLNIHQNKDNITFIPWI